MMRLFYRNERGHIKGALCYFVWGFVWLNVVGFAVGFLAAALRR